ncbi:MAG: low molecular weight phosphotyrosine protein phosphatase [Spirochaetia bacterium]|nr:low molecular weight phosphotyrosine protein phosphatase [Spirochaetia bacterium]
MKDIIQIVFVCLGNICRSPLAQGIFEKKIKEKNLEDKFVIDSAGTSGWHDGEPPHPGSVQIAKEYGAHIQHQKSRPVHMKDKDIFDYFIAMDQNNANTLHTEFAVPKEKIYKLREFDKIDPGSDVMDPFGYGPDAFDDVYKVIERSVEGFIKFLQKKHPTLLK